VGGITKEVLSPCGSSMGWEGGVWTTPVFPVMWGWVESIITYHGYVYA
jgi:hypothetical protein